MKKYEFIKALTDTGYPSRISNLSPEFLDFRWAVLACGDNLDAPEFIQSGGLFYAPMIHESLPIIAYKR